MSIRLFPPTFQAWESNNSDRQIAVLMSGGVDSSVAGLLLKEAGWSVLGITMKIPVAQQCSHPSPCCGAGAAVICRQLGISHYFLDVEGAFDKLIISPFRRAYAQGRTPSPCADCNSLLKFSLVWDFLEETFGIKNLATGHYARIVRKSGSAYLARASDRQRDQSYFLYGTPHDRLTQLVFPLGELSKQEVRELAHRNRFEVAERPDSMELCFAGEANYRNALEETSASSGPILDTAGKVLGHHQGISNFTVGQRRGLGVAAGAPLYVVRICPQDNSVTLGTREQASRRDVRAKQVNTFQPERLRPGEKLFGQIRSPGQASACTIVEVGPEATLVEFAEPQFGPCSGQRLVLYDEDGLVAAGGTIDYANGQQPSGQAETRTHIGGD